MKKLTRIIVVGLVTIGMTACSENPVAEEDDSGFVAELSAPGDHVSTLTETTFEIELTKTNGDPVTDVQAVQLQFLREGTDRWRGEDLTPHGSHFEAAYTFSTSGEYKWRIARDELGDGEFVAMYESSESLDVERIHQEVGDYRVEFETFPGHVHSGSTVTVSFWVKESDGDDHHGHGPVVGLESEIECQEANGALEHHDGLEDEAGVYSAEHTFVEHGDARMSIRFHGHGGGEHEAEFEIHVVAPH